MVLINFNCIQVQKNPLNKINRYLINFDNGDYGHTNMKDGYSYNYFKLGYYNKVNIFELAPAIEEETNRKVAMSYNT